MLIRLTAAQVNKKLHAVYLKNKKFKKRTHGIYLRIVAKPLETESFKEGETGAFPKNTSKRARVTFPDSISASTLDGSPFEETQTWKSQ